MSYKIAQLKPEQTKKLSENLNKEITNLKEYSEGFDDLFYDIFKENDARLFALVEKELAALEKTKAVNEKEKSGFFCAC